MTLSIFILIIGNCKKKRIEPSISLLKQSDCKNNMSQSTADLKFSNQRSTMDNKEECIEYTYNKNTRSLFITHINAAFNCCPGKIAINIESIDKKIIISENEETAGCSCNCLFDLEIEINNLEPGNYYLIIKNKYAKGTPEPQFECNLNLSQSVSDKFCVSRSSYPWNL